LRDKFRDCKYELGAARFRMDQLENSYYDENDKKEMELENVRELELTISDLE